MSRKRIGSAIAAILCAAAFVSAGASAEGGSPVGIAPANPMGGARPPAGVPTSPAVGLTSLASGSRGDEVRIVQRRLYELGFMEEPADGHYGPKTEAAVRALRQYLNEREGGATNQSFERLEETEASDRIVEVEDGYGEGESPDDADDPPDGEGAAADELSGDVDYALWSTLLSEETPWVYASMRKGDQGSEVLRLQTRLFALAYIDRGRDGIYGERTEAAVKSFQKRHKLSETGVADEATLSVLFSPSAQKSPKPPYAYQLKIDVSKQTVGAYAWSDADGAYTKLVRTMKCSTGLKSTPTPTGTFASAGPVARWGYFPKWDVYAQYLFRIKGPILFHSVLYRAADESTLIKSSLRNLGKRASHGCVRLSVEDAKWIYTNCAKGTTVIVS